MAHNLIVMNKGAFSSKDAFPNVIIVGKNISIAIVMKNEANRHPILMKAIEFKKQVRFFTPHFYLPSHSVFFLPISFS